MNEETDKLVEKVRQQVEDELQEGRADDYHVTRAIIIALKLGEEKGRQIIKKIVCSDHKRLAVFCEQCLSERIEKSNQDVIDGIEKHKLNVFASKTLTPNDILIKKKDWKRIKGKT